MSDRATADVIDLRDGEGLLLTVLEVIGQRADARVELDDLDRELESDLGLRPCHRFEIAGELAELMSLPGADDDAVNSCVIQTLALSRTPRALAINVGALFLEGLNVRSLRPVPAFLS